MSLENLIDEALCRPANHISYYVSHRLAELYSAKEITEGSDIAFCLEAFVRAWNDSLEPELKLSDAVVFQVIEQTEVFSFAYMKEMFLSSMMQWVASPVSGGMDDCIRNRAEALREQMSSMIEEPVAIYVDDED